MWGGGTLRQTHTHTHTHTHTLAQRIVIQQPVFVLNETRHDYDDHDHDDDDDVDSFDGNFWGLWEQVVEYLLKPNSFSEVYQRN